VGAIDDVTPRPTVWTTGIIIEKDLPTPTTVRLRMHVEDRQRHRPGQLPIVPCPVDSGFCRAEGIILPG